MNAVRFEKPLRWGELDVPLFGISSDWFGKPVQPPVAWSLALDPERFWFIASHGRPASIHPKARPGRFLAELWKFDVAELFIADPGSGRYLELNLSPNSAWWSCEFSAPRVRTSPDESEWPGVETFAELAADGTWVAAMALPLATLRERLSFGETTTANFTFIVESPEQRFLSASPLGDGEPDFHRPEKFQPLRIHDGGLPGTGSHP
ncbi:hypothetical protein [Haloferula helveola]